MITICYYMYLHEETSIHIGLILLKNTGRLINKSWRNIYIYIYIYNVKRQQGHET